MRLSESLLLRKARYGLSGKGISLLLYIHAEVAKRLRLATLLSLSGKNEQSRDLYTHRLPTFRSRVEIAKDQIASRESIIHAFPVV